MSSQEVESEKQFSFQNFMLIIDVRRKSDKDFFCRLATNANVLTLTQTSNFSITDIHTIYISNVKVGNATENQRLFLRPFFRVNIIVSQIHCQVRYFNFLISFIVNVMFIGHINIEIFKMTLILEAGFFLFLLNCWDRSQLAS